MANSRRKHHDSRQLPLPTPQGDTSPSFVMNSVVIPQSPTAQLELIPMTQQILCVKAPMKTRGATPEPNAEFFAWPDTIAPSGNGHIADADWPRIGLLKHVGYAVGVNGKLKSHRREKLEKVFGLKVLPKLISFAYIAQWGSPRSSLRLKKMAYSIASFCRNDKRRRWAIMKTAIANYEDDLAWLKMTYYDGRFDEKFRWPTTGNENK